MKKKDTNITSSAIDTDDIRPELDEDWFEEADAYVGTKLVRVGRPKSGNPKQSISIRLDAEVVAWFKKSGTGWQTRMNDALRKVAGI